jgi:guanylate kinase
MSSSTWKGVPVVLSGPSAVGKTTIRNQLLARFQDIVPSISATTRAPRTGEVHGKDYLFLSREAFEQGLRENMFLEYAEVHGELYGTPRGPLEDVLTQGVDALLVIDVQGGVQVKAQYPDALMVLLLPPSMAELQKRFGKRGDTAESDIVLRLKNAEWEIGFAKHYDYWVVNRSLEEAVREVRAILVADRCRRERAITRYARLGMEWPML